MAEKIYTPKEVADIYSVTEKTIKDWLRAGKLKGIKVGRLWRVRERDIESIVQEVYNGG